MGPERLKTQDGGDVEGGGKGLTGGGVGGVSSKDTIQRILGG